MPVTLDAAENDPMIKIGIGIVAAKRFPKPARSTPPSAAASGISITNALLSRQGRMFE